VNSPGTESRYSYYFFPKKSSNCPYFPYSLPSETG
jgi:hypothetical protein